MTGEVKSSAPHPAAPPRLDPNRTLTPHEEQVILHVLASLMGLPRLCVFKACRRSKICTDADMICIANHRGLVRKRLRAAIKRIAVPARKDGPC